MTEVERDFCKELHEALGTWRQALERFDVALAQFSRDGDLSVVDEPRAAVAHASVAYREVVESCMVPTPQGPLFGPEYVELIRVQRAIGQIHAVGFVQGLGEEALVTCLVHNQHLRNLVVQSPLSEITRLEYQWCFPRLAVLKISGDNLRSIGDLRGPKTLKTLQLECPHVTDLSMLGELTQLNVLAIIRSRAIDYSFLAKLTGLENLSLSASDISDFTPIEHLDKLKRLYLGQTGINTLRPLHHFQNLEILWLSPNQVPPEEVDLLRQANPRLRVKTTYR